MLDKISKRVPQPPDYAVVGLIRASVPASMWEVKSGDHEPYEWLKRMVIIAYQSGMYDEASTETFNMSL